MSKIRLATGLPPTHCLTNTVTLAPARKAAISPGFNISYNECRILDGALAKGAKIVRFDVSSNKFEFLGQGDIFLYAVSVDLFPNLSKDDSYRVAELIDDYYRVGAYGGD